MREVNVNSFLLTAHIWVYCLNHYKEHSPYQFTNR